MPTPQEQVRTAVEGVVEPELRRTLGELATVRGVTITGATATVEVALTSDDYPYPDELGAAIAEAVDGIEGVRHVDIVFGELSPAEQVELSHRLHGDPASTAGAQAAHGHAEGRSVPFARAGSRTRVLLIASGKGGVGKSSISTNLAIALTQRGNRVALVDADVWGFSIPRMIGATPAPNVIGSMIVPPESHGVRFISIGLMIEEDRPVIWRGPMLHKALEQFLTDVFWDEPDYLVIDLPPGTGDVALSLASFVPDAEAYIVTTPQPAAQKVAQRAAFMFRQENIRIPVRGVIENMSWFTGDDGTRYELFGAGGGQELAELLEVPLLGQVPLVPALRAGGDDGRPIMAVAPDAEASRAIAAIAERLDTELRPTRRRPAGLTIVAE